MVILAGRTSSKLLALASTIQAAFPSVSTRTLIIDLSSQASVRAAAAEVLAYSEPIDIVINNAGVMAIENRTLSTDGIEMQFATNHIGPFLFVNLIMPKVLEAAARNAPGTTRIINLTSSGHGISPVRFSDWNFEGKPLAKDERVPDYYLKILGITPPIPTYHSFIAYGQSKSADILFSLSLRQKLQAKGVLSVAVHPGNISTELQRHMSDEIRTAMAPTIAAIFRKSLDQGCSTTLVAALDPKLSAEGPLYLADCQALEPSPWASDAGLAERLWVLSEEIVGEKFKL